jgi:hypothetical protein
MGGRVEIYLKAVVMAIMYDTLKLYWSTSSGLTVSYMVLCDTPGRGSLSRGRIAKVTTFST